MAKSVNDKIQASGQQRTDLINQVIDGLDLAVEEAQKELLKTVISDFLDQLDTKDGVILNNDKNKRLLSLLDKSFNTFNSTDGLEVVAAVVTGVQKIVDFNANYYELFNQPAELVPITAQAKSLVDQWLGIEENGDVAPNGYLDTLINDPQIKNEVRNIAVKSIVNQEGYNVAKANISNYIEGQSAEDVGALEKYHRNFTYDMFSQVDRANSQVYADKLDLGYAIYEGGIIKTTRPFCKERNGKVFTRLEISQFDPPTAKPPGYNPFTDLGGYGCRHHLNWIPLSLAKTLRPDLDLGD